MAHTVLVYSLIFTAGLMFFGMAYPELANPIQYETQCSISEIYAYEISEGQYWVEFTISNTGDNDITSYEIMTVDNTVSRTQAILQGGSVDDELTVDNFEGGYIEVTVNTVNDSAVCSKQVTL